MTDVSAWLVGMVGSLVPFVLWYLGRTVFAQLTSGEITLRQSDPVRLAVSMILLVLGFSFFMSAGMIAPSTPVTGTATHLIWLSWGTIWTAEIIAISAIGNLGWPLIANMIWTIFILTWKFGL